MLFVDDNEHSMFALVIDEQFVCMWVACSWAVCVYVGCLWVTGEPGYWFLIK